MAAPLERLARPRLLEHLDAVLHERRPALDVEVELLVLLGPVAGAHRQAEPSLGDEVEHREVFGEPDRVVERQEDHAHADQHAFGDGGDGAAEHDRRRQVAVDRRVVLEEAHRVEAETVGPRALLERRLVEVDRGRTEVGRTHVVGQRHRDVTRFFVHPPCSSRSRLAAPARRREDAAMNQSTRTLQSIDLTIDVTDAAGLGEPLSTKATVTLPDPATMGAPPVVCFGFPGGGYSRQYFTFDMPDGSGGGQAGWHARRGWIFVSCDHLFVGESSAPSDPELLTFEVVAAANAATVAGVTAALADGTLADGFPAVGDATLLGIGQSMGGCFTIVQQGLLGTYAGIGVLGFSARQTMLAFPPDVEIGDDVFAVREDGLPINTWGFHYDDEPPDIVAQDMRDYPHGVDRFQFGARRRFRRPRC